MASQTFEHTALHHLRVTPDIVAELMEGTAATQAIAKKSEGEYSLAELLEYLSHSEAHFFRVRLDSLSPRTSAGSAEAPLYDRALLFAAGTYSGRDPDESFAHWQERREDNLEALEELTGTAAHGDTLALEALLRDWAAHDLCAIRQIAKRVSEQLYGA